jgi:hypothetical protein
MGLARLAVFFVGLLWPYLARLPGGLGWLARHTTISSEIWYFAVFCTSVLYQFLTENMHGLILSSLMPLLIALNYLFYFSSRGFDMRRRIF